ncbi:MAG: hypothetical protein PF638_15820 [Candidatus Delongbacteria bacterium]|jgi:DNA-damage-inducible protein D|nr:hypothetical protein [Candidatus Delongbacteria bacterium]
MKKENRIAVFQNKKIRKTWHNNEWYFSIIDVVEVLTDSPRPRKYWNALKTKLQVEGNEVSQILGQLKIKSSDGKMRSTDVSNTEGLFHQKSFNTGILRFMGKIT